MPPRPRISARRRTIGASLGVLPVSNLVVLEVGVAIGLILLAINLNLKWVALGIAANAILRKPQQCEPLDPGSSRRARNRDTGPRLTSRSGASLSIGTPARGHRTIDSTATSTAASKARPKPA